jgi:hypothetical protein
MTSNVWDSRGRGAPASATIQRRSGSQYLRFSDFFLYMTSNVWDSTVFLKWLLILRFNDFFLFPFHFLFVLFFILLAIFSPFCFYLFPLFQFPHYCLFVFVFVFIFPFSLILFLLFHFLLFYLFAFTPSTFFMFCLSFIYLFLTNLCLHPLFYFFFLAHIFSWFLSFLFLSLFFLYFLCFNYTFLASLSFYFFLDYFNSLLYLFIYLFIFIPSTFFVVSFPSNFFAFPFLFYLLSALNTYSFCNICFFYVNICCSFIMCSVIPYNLFCLKLIISLVCRIYSTRLHICSVSSWNLFGTYNFWFSQFVEFVPHVYIFAPEVHITCSVHTKFLLL